jgi:hypothetical protein
MKNLRKKFQKIDFLIPIVIGALLIWWAVVEEEYVGVFLVLIAAFSAAHARWKWVNNYKNYRKKFEELKKESKKQNEEFFKKNGRHYSMFEWRLVPSIAMIITVFFGLLVANFLNHEYFKSLILLGVVSFFFLILLYFRKFYRKK